MSDRSRRLSRLALLMLAGLLAASGAQAQSRYREEGYAPPPPDRPGSPPPRPFADPDRAARAAREATGGRVLGVQQGSNPDGQNGQNGYRVRILQPDGRVRSLHFDPGSGAVRD
ncbi:MAG: hypothetical protein U1F70_14350 [Candidatus Competibacteraceae bacterium]